MDKILTLVLAILLIFITLLILVILLWIMPNQKMVVIGDLFEKLLSVAFLTSFVIGKKSIAIVFKKRKKKLRHKFK